MKSFLLILYFLLTISTITCISINWRSENEVVALYEEWLIKYQKLHSNLDEKIKRYEIFKDNLRYIDEQNYYNKVNQNNFTLGLNEFSDLTLQEFSSIYLGTSIDYEKIISSIPDDDEEYLPREDITQLPSAVDWRKKGVVFPIRQQGKCGSCWTFSAVASMESLVGIKDGRKIALSEQELLDCERTSYGCKGGFYDNAFRYTAQKGITSRDKYPYTGKQGQCQQKQKVVKISGYKRVPRNEAQIQRIAAQQVLSIAVKSNSSDFQHYKSGIFKGACGPKLDHAVNIVGYGSEGGVDYWIIRNSWGVNWGEKGYMRIPRNKNYCGVAMFASYPTK